MLTLAGALLAGSSGHSMSAVDMANACPGLQDWKSSSSPPDALAWQGSRHNDMADMHVDDPGSRKFDVRLTSPLISVPAKGLTLELTQQMQLSWANSAGVFELSIANGAWTDIIDAGGHFKEGGYNLRAYTGNPIGMRPAWAGSPLAFRTTAVLPASARNQAVRLRFRLGSGGTGDPKPGWTLRNLGCK